MQDPLGTRRSAQQKLLNATKRTQVSENTKIKLDNIMCHFFFEKATGIAGFLGGFKLMELSQKSARGFSQFNQQRTAFAHEKNHSTLPDQRAPVCWGCFESPRKFLHPNPHSASARSLLLWGNLHLEWVVPGGGGWIGQIEVLGGSSHLNSEQKSCLFRVRGMKYYPVMWGL